MKTTQYSMPVAIAVAIYILCFVASLFYSWFPFPSFPIGIVIALVVILMYKQTITVTNTHVKFSMGIGLIRGGYAFKIIESCKPITYFPFGWGIRFYPTAILYNVSGNKAIELNFNNGKFTRWLGTQIPEKLALHINEKLHESK